MTKVYSKSDDM